jgi:hypothetical protein
MSIEQSAAVPRFASGIERDLENARVLIEDEPWSENPQKYRKAAEVILRRILTVDPENELARHLLKKAEAGMPGAFATPGPVVEPELTPAPSPVIERLIERHPEKQRAAVEPEDYPFVVQTIGAAPEEKPRRKPVFGFLGIGIAVVLSGFLMFGVPSNRLKGQYAPRLAGKPAVAVPEAAAQSLKEASRQALTPAAAPVTSPALPAVQNLPTQPATPAPSPAPLAASVNASASAKTPQTDVVTSALAPAEIKKKAATGNGAGTGKLAVSSPTTVEIYMNDQLLGSAPITLELPAGNQRLEYRHQDMKKIVTHVINANETTTAMITFEVPVQINAKPWAQVFIDGSQRQPLGQTPLSDVRVPIGSVLVFENPNFQGKKYRVKGTETEIRVNFP